MRFFILAIFFAAFWMPSSAGQADATLSIQEIEIFSPGDAKGRPVKLPHFIAQSQSGLHTVRWQIRLPAQLADAEIPALLIPQVIQGARFQLAGQWIYDIASSNERVLRNWYSPALIQLPKALMSTDGDNVLYVEQRGHLRGWFIAPMLVGELRTLQPIFESYALISQTITVSLNVLCGLMGIFLLVIGLKSKTELYVYGGIISGLWSLLIALGLIGRIPHDWWFLWRLVLYFLTGWLVYCEILFNFAVFQRELKLVQAKALLAFMNAGWMAFAVFGKSAEQLLDTVWTGLAVCLYVASLVWMIGIAAKRRDWRRVIPISVFLLLSMVLSFHDYALQTGALNIMLPDSPQALWSSLAQQPIYLAHLGLPAFIAMTLWLVGRDHIKITRNQLLHELQLSQERERIVSDIHDGVGARINLLLWRLRTKPPEISHVSNELQGCMDELRFAINPPQSGHATLHNTLESLVQRLAAANEGVRMEYQRLAQSSTEVSSETGLHIYKACQECLSNAIRHSGATHISVCLDHRDDEIEIVIQDNGHGIPHWDNTAQQQLERRTTSMGLLSLQRRLQQRKGLCRIESSGHGTQVRLTIPI